MAIWAICAVFLLFAAEMLGIVMAMGSLTNQGRHWLPYAIPQTFYFVGVLGLVTPQRLEALGAFVRHRVRLLRVATAAAATITLAALGPAVVAAAAPGRVLLAVQSSTDAAVRLFYDAGRGYTLLDSSSQRLRHRDGWVTLEFPVKARRIVRLRIDLSDGSGVVTVGALQIADADGRGMAALPPQALRAVDGVRRISSVPRGIEVDPARGPAAAILEVALEPPVSLARPGWPGTLDALAERMRAAFLAAPLLARLPALLPWGSLALGFCLLLTRISRRLDPRAAGAMASRLRWSAAAGWVALFLGLHAWLVYRTSMIYGT